MSKVKLPIGIQDFETVISEGRTACHGWMASRKNVAASSILTSKTYRST